MYSDIYETQIKSLAYAADPEKYMQWLDSDHNRFNGHSGEHMITRASGTLVCNCELFDRLARFPPEPYRAHSLAMKAALETRNAHPT